MIAASWEAMDLILTMYEAKTMFVGSLPRTTGDYLRRFALAMRILGYQLRTQKRRINGPAASKAGPRGLDNLSPVSSMFKPRYCKDDLGAGLSQRDIEIILDRHADDDNIDDVYFDESGEEWKTPYFKTNLGTEPDLDDEQKEALVKLRKRQNENVMVQMCTGGRPIQLLNTLLNELQSVTLELALDYSHLHISSWRFLRVLRQELDNDLKNFYGDKYLHAENQLPFVVGYIFLTATTTTKLADSSTLKKHDTLTSALTVKAAKFLETMLGSGAGANEHHMLEEYLGMQMDVPDLVKDLSGE